MRKLLFIIIIFGFTASLYAAVPDRITNLFYTGNTLYEQDRYKEAIEKYEEIIKAGYSSGPLYYNLGNCYFKLGQLGKTILYYERAKQFIPKDPELNFNLNYVKSLLEDKIEAPYRNWLQRKLYSMVYFFNLSTWIGFTVIVWSIFIISGIIAVLAIGFRKGFKYIGIISAVLLIIGFSSTLILYSESSSPQAIILSKEIPVRYGPGEGEVEAFLLHEGTKVTIKKHQEEWIQVQLSDGKTGWLPQHAVEKI